GHVARFAIVREKVVEGLVARGAGRLWNGLIPFLAIGEDRIDIEHHAAETQQAMAYLLADAEAGMGDSRGSLDHALQRKDGCGGGECGLAVLGLVHTPDLVRLRPSASFAM